MTPEQLQAIRERVAACYPDSYMDTVAGDMADDLTALLAEVERLQAGNQELVVAVAAIAMIVRDVLKKPTAPPAASSG